MKTLLVIAFLTLHGALATPCSNLLPGLERMSRGVDITTLDLFPTDLSLTSGFRQSLFDFTCNSSATWTHPSLEHFTFPLPDQIAAVNTVPGGALNDQLTIHKELKSYKKTLSTQVGLDVNTVAYGDYSLSVGYKNVQEEILNSNRTVADVSAYISAIQMDFKPFVNLKPNENFNRFLTKQLPATYSQSPEKFQEFLDTFGTHYFESAIFGGYLLQQTVIEDAYRYQTSDQEITTEIQAKYAMMVGGKVNVDHSTGRKFESFDRQSRTSHYYYGGQTNLVTRMSAEQFAQWSASVPRDPWLFGGRVKPIENLIENAALKAEVKTAVHVKLTKAYLQELKQTLVLISRQVPQTSAESSRISQLLAQTIPAEAEVKAIAARVQELVLDAQAVKDRAYLRAYSQKLNTLQHYELFCKKEVANRCDHEKKHDVNDAVAEASHLEVAMANLAAASGRPDTEVVRQYISQASELLWTEQNTPIAECREKLFCNLCKDIVIDLIKKEPCNTPHIKHLLRVQL